ncbi:MAG: hypothetical protein ACK56I_13345, partial [bacterium]
THLRAAAAESKAPQILQFTQRKLQPQREHEQHHAKLRHVRDAHLRILPAEQRHDSAVCDDDAADEITGQQRLLEPQQQQRHEHHAREHHRQQGEDGRNRLRSGDGQHLNHVSFLCWPRGCFSSQLSLLKTTR